MQSDRGDEFQVREDEDSVGEDSDDEDSLPPLSPLSPERGPNYGAPVQTDPLQDELW